MMNFLQWTDKIHSKNSKKSNVLIENSLIEAETFRAGGIFLKNITDITLKKFL